MYGELPYNRAGSVEASKMGTTATPKTGRLEARIPADLKAVLMRAAALQGRNLTEFILASASEAASRVLREHDVLELSEQDQLAFANALLAPPEASTALQNAAKRYRRETL